MPPTAPDPVKSLTPEDEKSVKSVSRLAEIIGISRPTVYAWLEAEPGLGKQTDGAFDVAAWREYQRRQGSKTLTGGSDDKNALQCRELELKNQALEFKLDVQRGRYTENTLIAAQAAEMVSEAKSVLRNKLEQELPAQLVGLTLAEIRVALRAVVVEVCDRISQPPLCVADSPAAAAIATDAQEQIEASADE